MRSGDYEYGMNGHIHFSRGQSENPQIGTT